MNPSVLIVEDEAIVAADLENKVRQLGYEVAGTTARGEEAVALVRAHAPALVLMDIRLAGAMDGIAAAAAIRRECGVPVVFLTAHSDAATVHQARQAEAFGYILKPFEDHDLRVQLEMALYKHAAEQRLRRSEERLRQLNEELEGRVARRTAELQAANRELQQEMAERQRLQAEVLQISEREQQRLGQDLHDDLGQHLTALRYMAETLQHELASKSSADARPAARLAERLQLALEQTRALARGLFPVELQTGGLGLALENLALSTGRLYPLRCHFRPSGDGGHCAPDPDRARQLYRIAQEAVNNAVKHSRAKNIEISLTQCGAAVALRIRDDGRGFGKAAADRGSMGIHIMRYRAGLIGATLGITSRRGRGTTVTCTFPVTADGAPP